MPVDDDPQQQGQRQPTPLQSQLLLSPSQRQSPLLPAPSREVQQQQPRLVPVPPQLMLPRQRLPPPQQQQQQQWQQQQQQPLSWPQLLPGVFRAPLSPPVPGLARQLQRPVMVPFCSLPLLFEQRQSPQPQPQPLPRPLVQSQPESQARLPPPPQAWQSAAAPAATADDTSPGSADATSAGIARATAEGADPQCASSNAELDPPDAGKLMYCARNCARHIFCPTNSQLQLDCDHRSNSVFA